MSSISGAVESLLRREVERLLGGPLDEKRLRTVGRALSDLHARFTSERAFDAAAPYLSDRDSLAAYLAYFFLASAAQVHRAWREISPPSATRIRILDVGSGPGPAGWATADWVRSQSPTVQEIELTAADVAPAALDVLKRLWPAPAGRLVTHTWSAGAPLPGGPYELIVASHFLNEAFVGSGDPIADRAVLVGQLLDRLAPGGRLMLIEPALRETGRGLLQLRDRLLPQGVRVLAPCLYTGPCPMLERPRDWCHADRPWQAPALVEAVATAAGLRRDSLKYAYLILTREAEAPAAEDALFRIVSEPLPEKGKRRYFGCGPAGRHALVRLDRERCSRNGAFDTLERGDIVLVNNTRTGGDGLRITVDSPVEVVLSAASLDGEGA